MLQAIFASGGGAMLQPGDLLRHFGAATRSLWNGPDTGSHFHELITSPK